MFPFLQCLGDRCKNEGNWGRNLWQRTKSKLGRFVGLKPKQWKKSLISYLLRFLSVINQPCQSGRQAGVLDQFNITDKRCKNYIHFFCSLSQTGITEESYTAVNYFFLEFARRWEFTVVTIWIDIFWKGKKIEG